MSKNHAFWTRRGNGAPLVKKIAISIGDVCGISIELLYKAVVELQDNLLQQAELFVFCNKELFLKQANKHGVKIDRDILSNLTFIEIFNQTDLKLRSSLMVSGQSVLVTIDNGIDIKDESFRAKVAGLSLDAAIESVQSGQCDALLTLPLDKKIMRHYDESFCGHTEYLQKKCNVKQTWMMMHAGQMCIVLLSNHIDLKDVEKSISAEKLEAAVIAIQKHFEKNQTMDKSKAKIAVCALNPHAGELSKDSIEERVLRPCIEAMQAKGHNLSGPHPADALFAKECQKPKFDAIIAMYHDQGLIPAKMQGLENTVNITLGLPFTRVSPAHGTAYDIVGQSKVDVGSVVKALNILFFKLEF